MLGNVPLGKGGSAGRLCKQPSFFLPPLGKVHGAAESIVSTFSSTGHSISRCSATCLDRRRSTTSLMELPHGRRHGQYCNARLHYYSPLIDCYSADEVMKIQTALSSWLLGGGPATGCAAPFNLAFKTQLKYYEWLEQPGNEHRLRRFGHGMNGTRSWELSENIIHGTLSRPCT